MATGMRPMGSEVKGQAPASMSQRCPSVDRYLGIDSRVAPCPLLSTMLWASIASTLPDGVRSPGCTRKVRPLRVINKARGRVCDPITPISVSRDRFFKTPLCVACSATCEGVLEVMGYPGV